MGQPNLVHAVIAYIHQGLLVVGGIGFGGMLCGLAVWRAVERSSKAKTAPGKWPPRPPKGAVARTRIVDIPYARTMHKEIADLTDPVASEVFAIISGGKLPLTKLKFHVDLQLRDASGRMAMPAEVMRYDPSYDFDKEIERAYATGLSGHALHEEMPGDVAFRIHGKSCGSFMGGWIAFGFKKAFEQAYGEAPVEPYGLHAIIVYGWRADRT